MFKNVVVGVDGEQGGRDALALARLLRGEAGQLTLAYVFPKEPLAWRGSSAAYEAAQREDGQAMLEAARGQAGVDAHLRCYGSASAGRGLHELAEAIRADLLVIGSSRRGLLGRVLVGDDTRGALNGAPCAVAIAPAGYSEQTATMREIGVGYDGSRESRHALGLAKELAGEHAAKLSAFEAVSLPTSVYLSWGLLDEGAIEEMVESARERIAALGGVEPHATYGLASEELALYSASLDLLVIGSRGYGPIGRLVHGSTAHELARTARCPLLVLTRAARKTDAVEASDAELEGAAGTRRP